MFYFSYDIKVSTEDKKRRLILTKSVQEINTFFYRKTYGLLNMVTSSLKTHLKGPTQEANANKIKSFL